MKGDWGAGTPEQAAVTERMCQVRETTPFEVVLTVGDNFYDPDGRATAGNYEEPEACLVEHPDHRWRATWGNHDAGGEDTFDVLGARRWYRWRSGPAAFFAMNSNRIGEQGQRQWLAEALAAERAPVKIVYFHHSPYTVGSDHPPDRRVQEQWVPLFEEHDVTLVLTGHSHTYEHHVRNEVDYVVTGGGGRSLDACERIMTTLVRCVSEHHFTLLRITFDRVVVHAITADGETLDRFVVAP